MPINNKIIAIMSDLKPIGKNQTNNFHKYKFRGIDDVLNALHPALVRHGVFFLPRVKNVEQDVKTTETEDPNTKAKGVKNAFHTKLTVDYKVIDSEDDSYLIIKAFGEALDTSDKSFNKALSQAFKYAVIQLFCIPTEDMGDADRDSLEIGTKERRPLPQKRTVLPSIDEQGEFFYDFSSIEEISKFREVVAWAIQNGCEQIDDTVFTSTRKLNKLVRYEIPKPTQLLEQIKEYKDLVEAA